MCGIAGMIDLNGRRPAPPGAVARMARALLHRGPDDDGFYDEPGVHLANRRLSIVGLADGKQPIANEDGTVHTVLNGEFFDYPEVKAKLEAKGHTFRTHTDTELVPHLWEDHGPKFLDHLTGQYAICVFDSKTHEVVLARDRNGICPLFYATAKHDGGEWLLFASEVKGLLASGFVAPGLDRTGLNHFFTFFGQPGPRTMFAGVNVLLPGRYLHLKPGQQPVETQLTQRIYWQVEYPDEGKEDSTTDERTVVDKYEQLLLAAVNRRLRADVPVVSYLSGGVDSSLVVAMANKALGRPIPTFTIAVRAAGMNEESEALAVAKHLGCAPVVVDCTREGVRAGYPELIAAAEFPVMDTSCHALMELAKAVHAAGFKVALTGEGPDEWLAGYPWFKVAKALNVLGPRAGIAIRQAFLRFTGQPRYPAAAVRKVQANLGGHSGWLDLYGMHSLNKIRFYNADLKREFLGVSAYDDLDLNPALHRWHPFHRGLYLGARIMLPGHQLACKGDRIAMHSSVETRYPFLDEELTAYTATLHPKWKLRGLFNDKYVERKVAERWLPKDVAWRRKKMFRAPMDSFQMAPTGGTGPDRWVEQVLSRESIAKTGLFDYDAVAAGRQKMLQKGGLGRTGLEMGLTAVTATQLWHHLYMGGGLADIPTARAAA